MSLDTAPRPDPSVFDEIIERRGTRCSKWDAMERQYGVSPEDGLAMWVADMDFRSPPVIQDAVAAMHAHGVYGYLGDDSAYRAAIGWWMRTRHGWQIEPDWIFSTHGLVNAVGLCVDLWTGPGDGIVLTTPVYHAFARVIRAAGRAVVECPLARSGDRYTLDIDAWEAALTGRERMLILCSPHNPGGRVWTPEELTSIAGFAQRHDLLLVSDEIHADLVYPGARHTPMATLDHPIRERLVMLTAASKTFNIAGVHIGNLIVEAPELRRQVKTRLAALGSSPNSFGETMVTAAYGPEGAAWVDALVAYLDGNRRLFDAGIAAIPGLRSMPLEATYLSWVDFAGTGMETAEILERVQGRARIAANHGTSFGSGGECFLRFNIGTPRARVAEAVARLQAAFADLQ